MIHYHCADMTTKNVRLLAGRHMLISHAYPRQAELAHLLSQSVLLDNGAFTYWSKKKKPDWKKFYDWCDEFFDCPTTWAIIPDVIDAGEEEQDRLVDEWPFGDLCGAPVWHLDEPLDRLKRLVGDWQRVCIGSSGKYATIATTDWYNRMDEVFDVAAKQPRLPWLHGLRMQGESKIYPFGSVDSADVARNNNRPQNNIPGMAERWDRAQCDFVWRQKIEEITRPVKERKLK